MECTLTTDCCTGDGRFINCFVSRRRLVIAAAFLQLALGLGLGLLGVTATTRLPTAVLWPTLAAVVLGLLSIALSYTSLLANRYNTTLLAAGSVGWSFALLFIGLGAETFVISASWPSTRALCETDDACAGATVEEVGEYCALAARCSVGMSALLFCWAVVQQWLIDVRRSSDRTEAHPTARFLGGSLAVLVVAGGVATASVAVMMMTLIEAEVVHPAVVVGVGGVAALGVLSAALGAFAWRRSSRVLWMAGWPQTRWSRPSTLCSLAADAPRWLAGAWIGLSTVLFSWSAVNDDARSNWETRWEGYARAWPDQAAHYCAEVLPDGDGEDAAECTETGFREMVRLYQLAVAAVLVGFAVQILIVRLLRRAVHGVSVHQRYGRESKPMGMAMTDSPSSYPQRPRGLNLRGRTPSSPRLAVSHLDSAPV